MAKEMPRQQKCCRGISLANEKTNKYYEEKIYSPQSCFNFCSMESFVSVIATS